MVGNAAPQKKKNIKPRKPTSLNVTRTNQFLVSLAGKYDRYMTLSGGSAYRGSRHKLSFRCELCGHVSLVKSSTMLKGSGCRKCRTNSQHISDMVKHMRELKARNKFRLTVPVPTFSNKTKYTYSCNTCDGLHYARPSEVLDENFVCTKCFSGGGKGAVLRLYAARLNMLYTESRAVKILDMYSSMQPMYHMCEMRHVWEATTTEMLTGMGCPECNRPVQVKKMLPIVAYNKRMVVRNRLEEKAIKAVKEYNGSLMNVFTSFSYPIPPTLSSHCAAFYVKNRNTLVDVIRFEKVKSSESKLVKSHRRATELGYNYIVITVREANDGSVVHEILDAMTLNRMRKNLAAKRKAEKEKAAKEAQKKVSAV